MSDFERRREKNKEARELVKIRKENIAKYFFDLSKLTFAALVLGLGGAFFNIGNREWFAYIGTLILKIDSYDSSGCVFYNCCCNSREYLTISSHSSRKALDKG